MLMFYRSLLLILDLARAPRAAYKYSNSTRYQLDGRPGQADDTCAAGRYIPLLARRYMARVCTYCSSGRTDPSSVTCTQYASGPVAQNNESAACRQSRRRWSLPGSSEQIDRRAARRPPTPRAAAHATPHPCSCFSDSASPPEPVALLGATESESCHA